MDWRNAGLWPAALVLSAVALGSASLQAAAPVDVPGVKQITSIEGITEYELPNGFRVLLFPDDSKPTVTVNMTVLVGSRHEGYGEAGMAHLLEHMLFKGTPRYPEPTAIPSAMKERGAHFNASTWFDRTNFHETLPSTDANLEFAIQLEADRLVNSFIRGADLKSEMTVVRNEFEMGENDPESILMQRMIATAYEWHNYGKSTIGNRADIERVPIENLHDFYVRYYQPDNAMLVVAGKFQPKKVLELAAKYFGRLPRPERQLNSTYTEEPPQDGDRIVRLRRVGSVAVVGATYHVPAGGEAEFPAVEVLAQILADDPSGRLYKSLIETKKAATVYGDAFSLHDPGVMILMARVAQGQQPEQVLKAMQATIAEVAEKGVTKEETERIKQQILKQREMDSANSARIALQLSEWAAQGDWRLYFLHRDRIEKVTAEQVSKAAAKYLKPDNATFGLFIPTKSPERATIPMIADLKKSIGDYKGREDIALGESFDVSPQNIDAHTKVETLHSGIKAALLEKKTRGHVVHLRLILRYGDVKSLHGMQMPAQLLPHLMIRGTKSLTHQQIQDELDKLRATLHVDGGPGDAAFTIETRRETLPAVLKLLGQILREPSLPESELEILKRSELAELENGLTEPRVLAMNAVRRHLAPYEKGDPRYVPTTRESMELIKAVTAGDLQRLYSSFLGGSHGELAIVGDFDTAQTVAAFDSILSDWKAEKPFAHISRDVKTELPGGREQIETPDKANAMYFGALVFPMRDNDPDYAPLAVGDFILGSSTLSSRLGDRVRQHEGLSYGIRSTLGASAEDLRTSMSVYAICNPANIEKVRKAIKEEIDRLLDKGIPAPELIAAKQGFLQQEQLGRTQDATLVQMFCENLTVDRSMKYYADLEKGVSDLTPDGVIAAMRRRIDPKRFYIVTAGDFNKTEAPAGQ
ncbi:MAG TPA: pitrilysin family protein [Planctomycetaceae bacterium]|jgi:zinc protease|nr:pitrilysin family protein [Planctomycetaceae bacterium]